MPAGEAIDLAFLEHEALRRGRLGRLEREKARIHGHDDNGDYKQAPRHPAPAPRAPDARIKANLRRVDTFRRDGSVEGVYRCAGFEVDARARAVLAGGRERQLTEMEFQILVFLMRNPGRCFTPSELYRNVWGQDSYGEVRTVIAHVHNIRAKVEPDPSSPRYLVRVRGRGYCFLPEGQAPGEPGSRPAPEAGRRARGRRAAN